MYRPTLPLTMPEAQTALAEGVRAIESGADGIDLSDIAAVDSAAVVILLAWQRAAQARRAALSFHNPPAALRSLAALYGVSELLALPDERH